MSFEAYSSILSKYSSYSIILQLAHYINSLCNVQHVTPYNLNLHTLHFDNIYLNQYDNNYTKDQIFQCLFGYLLFINWKFVRISPFYFTSGQYCITGDNIYYDKKAESKIGSSMRYIDATPTPSQSEEESSSNIYAGKKSFSNQESLNYYFYESSLNMLLDSLKFMLFDDIRNLLFSNYIFNTTSVTIYSMDDYELPSSIPVFKLNRIIADYSTQSKVQSLVCDGSSSNIYRRIESIILCCTRSTWPSRTLPSSTHASRLL